MARETDDRKVAREQQEKIIKQPNIKQMKASLKASLEAELERYNSFSPVDPDQSWSWSQHKCANTAWRHPIDHGFLNDSGQQKHMLYKYNVTERTRARNVSFAIQMVVITGEFKSKYNIGMVTGVDGTKVTLHYMRRRKDLLTQWLLSSGEAYCLWSHIHCIGVLQSLSETLGCRFVNFSQQLVAEELYAVDGTAPDKAWLCHVCWTLGAVHQTYNMCSSITMNGSAVDPPKELRKRQKKAKHQPTLDIHDQK